MFLIAMLQYYGPATEADARETTLIRFNQRQQSCRPRTLLRFAAVIEAICVHDVCTGQDDHVLTI
jgi:hypothetical protein